MGKCNPGRRTRRLPCAGRRSHVEPLRKRSGRRGQPLLRERAGGREYGSMPDQGRRRIGIHRRRRGNVEPRAAWVGRRRNRRRSAAGDGGAFRAARSLGGSDCNGVRIFPRRLRRLRGGVPEQGREGMERRAVFKIDNAGQRSERPFDTGSGRAHAARNHRRRAIPTEAFVQRHGRDHARLRQGRNSEIPAFGTHRARAPRRQFLGNRGWRRGRAARRQGVREEVRHQAPRSNRRDFKDRFRAHDHAYRPDSRR